MIFVTKRNLLIIGLLLLGCSLFIQDEWFPPFSAILRNSFLMPAICLIIAGLLMLLYAKSGKFKHRDRLLNLYPWKGNEEVLDIGTGGGFPGIPLAILFPDTHFHLVDSIGKKITVEEYNKKCREAVLRYKDKWDEITTKMGYWVDLNNPYITFENNYIETLWWILSTLYKKGYLYQSVSIQPYSPAAGTGLSSHELNQPGTYKDVKDTSVVAMFKAIQSTESKFLFDAAATNDKSQEVYYMAWTTTPWTLPSNLGLTVGPNIDYVLVATYNPYTALPVNVVIAKALISKYFKETWRFFILLLLPLDLSKYNLL